MVSGPGLRVLVDTKQPVLKLSAEQDRDGQVLVRWEIDKPNINPDSLSIVYRPSPTGAWQAVPIDHESGRRDSLQRGETTFRPASTSTEIPIRAEVADTAGNTAVANIRVAYDPAVRSAREASRPQWRDDRKSPAAGTSNDGGGIPPTPNSPRPSESQDAGPALTTDAKVAAAAGPSLGLGYSSSGESSDTPLPPSPPAEHIRMVNSLSFELDFEVESVGPTGIGRVELWGTDDGGQTWKNYGADAKKRSPLQVKVRREGVYGFRVVVANGAGFGGKPPVAGDQPDIVVGVDLTKPIAQLISAKQGDGAEMGQLLIRWQASDDRALGARPITLSFSEKRGGPWFPIAAGLENTGRYAWPLDNRTPGRIYLRLEVRDEAGNLAVDETSQPTLVDQSHPTVRIRSVRPAGTLGTARRP
jgi:hypothetical protein